MPKAITVQPEETPQGLRCKNCKQWLVLSVEKHDVSFEEIILDCEIPFLRCLACGEVFLPGRSLGAVAHMVEGARQRGVRRAKLALKLGEMRKTRFAFCQGVPLQYDPVDYYYVPGLTRPWNEGYLTPVFFDRRVLVQYYHDTEYTVSFASDTYGTIHTKSGHMVVFGINRSGKVLMWLGDIDDLPQSEQLYLASKNVASDHDVGSEFYEGQIEAIFTQYSKEILLVRSLAQLTDDLFENYKLKLLQLDEEALPLIKSLKRPIQFSEKEMSDSIESLAKLLVERINTEGLKGQLQQVLNEKEYKAAKPYGGLKAFELWLERGAGVVDASARIVPLFVLYDLRTAYKHLTSKETKRSILETCRARLDLAEDASAMTIYDTLLARLTAFYSDLKSALPAPRTSS